MKLSIKGKELRIEFSFWETVWGMKRSFGVRLEQITEAHGREPQAAWTDLRMPGTYVPWLIMAGSYWTRRGWEFWYVVRKQPFITLELKDHRYKRIILSMKDAERWVKTISAAITR